MKARNEGTAGKKGIKITMKKISTMDNILCLFIILCPLLDAASFLYRQYFHTNYSISTFLRPIIPITLLFIVFFKEKIKWKMLLSCFIYGIYAIIHLIVFHQIKTECAYGNEIRELQYLVNYTFMIANLFLYVYMFSKRSHSNLDRLKKSVLISLTIYISFMYLSILTQTSSATYIETGVGLKGWFESGNSIGTTMILALFVILPFLEKENPKWIKIWVCIISVAVGVYLMTLLGTRTGMIGFILVLVCYLFLCLCRQISRKSFNKKFLWFSIILVIAIVGVIGVFGSKTFERRKELKSEEDIILDIMTNQPSHVTGDTIHIVDQIQKNEIDETYMSKEMMQSYLDLYHTANRFNLKHTNMRMLQLVYHTNLVKHQHNLFLILFGNGYMTHFYEMIFEMEVPAFLFNFGILGFVLYFLPFAVITIYGVIQWLKHIKEMSIEKGMHILGSVFAILASFLSGYTFFNASTMMMIIVLNTFILKEYPMNDRKKKNEKEII